MAMAAQLSDLETPVEERVARLEANVEHIQADVSDMKNEMRRMNDKIDPALYALRAPDSSLAFVSQKSTFNRVP